MSGGFIGGLVDDVAGAVGDIAGAVGDVVSSVGDAVASTVDQALKDPVGTIAKVAAVATGNAWALPLISGADTLAHGGSLENALVSAGTAYVGGQIAPAVGGAIADAGVGAGLDAGFAGSLGTVAGGAASSAAGALLQGRDPLQALISGGVSAGVGALTSQIPGFSDLPGFAQSMVRNAISSELIGQSPSQDAVSRALNAGKAAAQTNAPDTAAASTSGLTNASGTTPVALATPTGGLPGALPGGLSVVGKSGYDAPEPGLKQIYSDITGPADTPTAYTPSPIYTPLIQQLGAPMQPVNTFPSQQFGMYPQPSYYADGGLVQNFSDGDQPVDNSAETKDVMAALKSLGDTDLGFKPKGGGLLRVPESGAAYRPKVLPQLMALLQARGMQFADGGQPSEHPGDYDHPNYDGTPVFRTGGLEGLGGKYVEGKGDGTSDDISAMLANGEYVFSADVVSALGNGSNKAGADRLSDMVKAIRERARSAPADKLPPDAKSPLEYLKSSKGKKNG